MKEQKRRIAKLASSIFAVAHELPVQGEWLDDIEIQKIENDPTVISSVSKRKATTLKKSLHIRCDDEAIEGEFNKILDYTFRSQVLDTVLQGMSVFELNWQKRGTYHYPIPVERDYRSFGLLEGDLIYEYNKVDPLKAIYLTHRAKFNAKLGRPLYETLFWLRRFKAASMEFWVEFMERFGKPWVVGKSDGDKDIMAQELYSMLGGDVAVVEKEDDITLVTPADRGGFAQILNYIDDQIRETVTGVNLTGNVKQGSYAAAKTHKEVSEEIALSDEQLLLEAIEKILDRFKRLNAIETPIVATLEDKNKPNVLLADRDATLASLLGDRYAFSKEYLTKTYNIDIEELKSPMPKAMKFSKKPPMMLPYDPIDEALHTADTKELENSILDALNEIFKEASSYDEAYDLLVSRFDKIDEHLLLEHFERFITLSMIYGNAEAKDETE